MIRYTKKFQDRDREAVISLFLKRKSLKRISALIRIVAIVGLAIMLWAVWFAVRVHLSRFLIIYVPAGAFFAFIAFGGYRLILRSVILKALRKQQDHSGAVEYTFEESGVTARSEQAESKYAWGSFRHWGYLKDLLYIQSEFNGIILVDPAELPERDRAALTELLSRKIDQ